MTPTILWERNLNHVEFLRDGIAEGMGHLPHWPTIEQAMCGLTICIITLSSGRTVVGSHAAASAEGYDPVRGEKLAREDALRQISEAGAR